jgi:hypothetical protein
MRKPAGLIIFFLTRVATAGNHGVTKQGVNLAGMVNEWMTRVYSPHETVSCTFFITVLVVY